MPEIEPLSFPSLTRIGVIGDVHAESTYLSAALSFLRNKELQAILCVGDIVDGSGSVDDCCAALKEHRVITVSGNHDQWFLSNELRNFPNATLTNDINPHSREFIATLPVVTELQTIKGRLLLCHGIGKNDMGRVTPDDYGYAINQNLELQELIHSHHYTFVVNGHTHRRMVRRFEDLTIINAGTLKNNHQPCFLTLDFKTGFVQFYDLYGNGTITAIEGDRHCFS